eukprot:PhM_4_TR3129/c0_g1_i1/m.69646
MTAVADLEFVRLGNRILTRTIVIKWLHPALAAAPPFVATLSPRAALSLTHVLPCGYALQEDTSLHQDLVNTGRSFLSEFVEKCLCSRRGCYSVPNIRTLSTPSMEDFLARSADVGFKPPRTMAMVPEDFEWLLWALGRCYDVAAMKLREIDTTLKASAATGGADLRVVPTLDDLAAAVLSEFEQKRDFLGLGKDYSKLVVYCYGNTDAAVLRNTFEDSTVPNEDGNKLVDAFTDFSETPLFSPVRTMMFLPPHARRATPKFVEVVELLTSTPGVATPRLCELWENKDWHNPLWDTLTLGEVIATLSNESKR